VTDHVRRPRRRGASDATRFAGSGAGRVLAVEPGVAEVVLRGQLTRASYGGGLLADMARDPSREPRVGDRVRLTCWADGHVTVDRVVARPVAP
jgi:hypothetical protein